MEQLELSKIQEILKQPSKKAEIQKAISQQNKVKFHVEIEINFNQVIANEFLIWVASLIPKDKYQTFLSLFRMPVITNELTEQIFQDLKRVYEARNPYFDYSFTDNKWGQDYDLFKTEILKLKEKISNEWWEAFKINYNSIIIVDLPEEQEIKSELPQPYFYLLNIENVIDIGVCDNKIEWIIFKQDNNKIAVFDEINYSLFQCNENYAEITSTIYIKPHNLNECPAKFFWNENLNSKSQVVKKSVFSNQLSNLDWFLFFAISKRQLDLYAGYPIYSGYQQDCDFIDEATNDRCDGGFVRNSAGYYKIQGNGLLVPCPICSEKRLHGAGSFVEVPIPKEGQPDLKNPIQITTIDTNSLDYNTKELERIRTEIYTNIVGYGGETINQAINEKQVIASYESRKNILIEIKKQFEQSQEWVEKIICKLRYDSKFKSNTCNWGNEFYIYSAQDLQNLYSTAKNSGITDIELDSISNQILETENKNNIIQLKRSKILKDLEPLRHKTTAEVIQLAGSNLINQDDAKIKLNFVSLIDRFERENGSVVDFGSALKDYYKKIDSINLKLKEYVKQEATTT